MRLIDADALLERVDKEREYLIARGQTGAEHILVHNFRELVENAPTVKLTEEQAIDKLHETGWLIRHDKEMTERPQGDIRWTDKVFVKSNGDIIDFEGRVVGHINLDIMKGGGE